MLYMNYEHELYLWILDDRYLVWDGVCDSTYTLHKLTYKEVMVWFSYAMTICEFMCAWYVSYLKVTLLLTIYEHECLLVYECWL